MKTVVDRLEARSLVLAAPSHAFDVKLNPLDLVHGARGQRPLQDMRVNPGVSGHYPREDLRRVAVRGPNAGAVR